MNWIDPYGLLVLGGGFSGSAAVIVGGDASAAVVHAIGNDTGVLVNAGGSFGPQAALGLGFTGVFAPFAGSVNDLKGTTFDFQLRLGFQLTISIPLNGWKGLAFAFDFPPGPNLGLGLGFSQTWIFGGSDPCD